MIGGYPVVIANKIRMLRPQHEEPFVLVEGRDDKLLFQELIKPNICKIVVVENKENVCEVISILDQDGFSGVIGLVDSDFDNLENHPTTSPNIVATDLHDIECMQLRSNNFDAVVPEFASQQKLDEFGENIRDALLTAARPIGHLRLYSKRMRLGLRFSGMSYNKFINKHTLSIDTNELIKVVKGRSNRMDLSNDSLLEGIGEIEALQLDPWQVCSGTDLLGVLSIGLQRAIGNNNPANVSDERLRQALRLSFRKEDFDQTEMTRMIRAWQMRNEPFIIIN